MGVGKVKGEWWLRLEVVAFRGMSGDHSGTNLGCYMFALCQHVGIINKD